MSRRNVDDLVSEAVYDLKSSKLKEREGRTNLQPSPVSQDGMLVEMAQINKREQADGIFPYISYKVQIWSDDHTPPHFHVLSDGCSVSLTIPDGEIYRVASVGKKSTYNYIVANAKAWLNCPCTTQPKLTNRENANPPRDSIHPND
jgi:hypothetical protein